ncbi:APC family permease [Acidipropionibacterium virtanenii]|uniref:Serine/threonine exchanger SteT n=1 Tax=Acidipropionibacterium virtanenii TaxID=2057246 RepID=A0A344UQL4_9ACTN|nr:amino acid permease [Acidipropionibacterium virtanenii]AXE37562.1 Serine/threonine exchanger SteT [Acidipropionibacterium virtanenii]
MTQVEKGTGGGAGFKKAIGLFSGISLICGMIIGSGIFYSGSFVLERTHMSYGLALICWFIGGLLALLGSLCFAELGAQYPETGGEVVYLRKAYHPSVGFSFGFTMLMAGMTASIAALCQALPMAVKSVLNLSDGQVKLIAYALIIALTAYNMMGVKVGAMVGNITMIAKLIPLVLIIVAGLFLGHQTPHMNLAPVVDGLPASPVAILSMIGFGTVSVFWAYEGWENLGTVAGEMKNPRKDLPKAMMISAAICTALYLLFNFAIFRVLPAGTISSAVASGDLYLGMQTAKVLFGAAGGVLVLVCMVVAIFSCLNAEILAFPRNYYAMAEEGHFFKIFTRVSPRTGVPTTAMIAQCIVVMILITMGNLEQLTSMTVFTTMIYNTLTIVSVIVSRRKYPTLERPFKAWGYPAIVFVNVAIYVALMVNTFVTDPFTAIVGALIPVVSFIVYFAYDKAKKHGGGDAGGGKDAVPASVSDGPAGDLDPV